MRACVVTHKRKHDWMTMYSSRVNKQTLHRLRRLENEWRWQNYEVHLIFRSVKMKILRGNEPPNKWIALWVKAIFKNQPAIGRVNKPAEKMKKAQSRKAKVVGLFNFMCLAETLCQEGFEMKNRKLNEQLSEERLCQMLQTMLVTTYAFLRHVPWCVRSDTEYC